MSKLEVDAIEPQSGTTLTIGASGDSVTIPSGATLSSTDPLVFPAGTASLPAITTTGDTNTGIFFPAADTIGFAEGGAEAMRIDSSGNVGIGTDNPSSRVHIEGGDGTLRIYKPAYPRIELDCDNGNVGSQVVLQENNIDRARYEWDGTFLRLGTTGNGGDWFIERDGAVVATVSGSGVSNSSDARVKSNIRDADVGLDEILNLSAKLFERNSSPDITELGLIAQDIESAGIPHTIIERGHSGEEIKSVNQMGLIATLVNAVKELKTKNDSLEARITALENA